jgi:hypothetical protein
MLPQSITQSSGSLRRSQSQSGSASNSGRE